MGVCVFVCLEGSSDFSLISLFSTKVESRVLGRGLNGLIVILMRLV